MLERSHHRSHGSHGSNVTRLGRSTDAVFTKQTCKNKLNTLYKKGKTTISVDFKVGGNNEMEFLN